MGGIIFKPQPNTTQHNGISDLNHKHIVEIGLLSWLAFSFFGGIF